MRKWLLVGLLLLSGCYAMERFLIETVSSPKRSWRSREMIRKLNRKYGKDDDYGLR